MLLHSPMPWRTNKHHKSVNTHFPLPKPLCQGHNQWPRGWPDLRIRGLGWMWETCSFCVLKMGIPSEKQFFIWNMVINQWVQRHHMFRSHFYPGEAHFVALPSHGLILAAPSILRPGRGWICTIHHTWRKKRAWTLTSSPKGVIWGKKPILAELDTLHERIHTPILLCKILGQQIILGQETPNSVGGVEG
jgi:hypothetical protein